MSSNVKNYNKNNNLFFYSYVNAFKNYLQFEGRARVFEYVYFLLFHFLVSFVLVIIDMMAFGIKGPKILSTILGLITFIPHLALVWRRLHDTNRPGWLFLLPYICFLLAFVFGLFASVFKFFDFIAGFMIVVGVLINLVIFFTLFLKGDEKINKFGPPRNFD